MKKRFAYPLLAALAFATGCGSEANAGHLEEHNVPTDDSAPRVFQPGQARLDRLIGDETEAHCVIEGAVAAVGMERYESRYGITTELESADVELAGLAAIDMAYDLVDARNIADVVADCVDLAAVVRAVLVEEQVPGSAHQCVVTNGHRIFYSLLADRLNGDEDSVDEAAGQLNWTVSTCLDLNAIDLATQDFGPRPQFDEDSELELASTPEFCDAQAGLSASMEMLSVIDAEQPRRLELAYTDLERTLRAIEPLVPNAGVQNQIDELAALYLPLVEAARSVDWVLAAVDRDMAAGLEVLSPEFQPRLQELIDNTEQYGIYHCGHDLAAIRSAAIDDFESRFANPPTPQDQRSLGETTNQAPPWA